MQPKEERKKIIILDKGTKNITSILCCFLSYGPFLSSPTDESRPSQG